MTHRKLPERTHCGRCGKPCKSQEELHEHEKHCSHPWQI